MNLWKQTSETPLESIHNTHEYWARGSSPWTFRRCDLRPCLRRGRFWDGILGRRTEILIHEHRYCSLECFERALTERISQQRFNARKTRRKAHRIPLGLLLLSLRVIREEQLQTALQAQRESESGRIGKWLCRLFGVTEPQVTAALAAQWSCPVFPMDQRPEVRECADLVPLPILEDRRMVAVNWLPSSRVLHMAFAGAVDYTTLYNVEQVLECRTEPCIADESAVNEILQDIRTLARPWEVDYGSMRDPSEVAREVRDHAEALGPCQVRLALCNQYLWIRVSSAQETRSLLFRTDPTVRTNSLLGGDLAVTTAPGE